MCHRFGFGGPRLPIMCGVFGWLSVWHRTPSKKRRSNFSAMGLMLLVSFWLRRCIRQKRT
jgi:hypothetical protein